MCLTSNVFWNPTAEVRTHPFRKLFDSGCRTCLCTDNPVLIGSTLSEEYLLLQDVFGFTPGEIVKVMDYGFKSAFVPLVDRKALRSAALTNAIAVFKEHGIILATLDRGWFESGSKMYPSQIDLPADWESLFQPAAAAAAEQPPA
jgi:adenosine deaminase